MKTLTESVVIEAPAQRVFAFMDDVKNVGFHMSGRSSMAMMGSRLEIAVLSPQSTGVGATYRMWGKMMGLTIDFSETVTRYIPGREKVWETYGRWCLRNMCHDAKAAMAEQLLKAPTHGRAVAH